MSNSQNFPGNHNNSNEDYESISLNSEKTSELDINEHIENSQNENEIYKISDLISNQGNSKSIKSTENHFHDLKNCIPNDLLKTIDGTSSPVNSTKGLTEVHIDKGNIHHDNIRKTNIRSNNNDINIIMFEEVKVDTSQNVLYQDYQSVKFSNEQFYPKQTISNTSTSYSNYYNNQQNNHQQLPFSKFYASNFPYNQQMISNFNPLCLSGSLNLCNRKTEEMARTRQQMNNTLLPTKSGSSNVVTYRNLLFNPFINNANNAMNENSNSNANVNFMYENNKQYNKDNCEGNFQDTFQNRTSNNYYNYTKSPQVNNVIHNLQNNQNTSPQIKNDFQNAKQNGSDFYSLFTPTNSSKEVDPKADPIETFNNIFTGKKGWFCSTCKNFNFESNIYYINNIERPKCNRCKKGKTHLEPVIVFDPIEIEKEKSQCQTVQISANANTSVNPMNSKERIPRKSCSSTLMTTHQLEKNDKQKNTFSERPGDWVCFACKNINFAWRKRCNMCPTIRKDSEKLDEGLIVVEESPYDCDSINNSNTHTNANANLNINMGMNIFQTCNQDIYNNSNGFSSG